MKRLTPLMACALCVAPTVFAIAQPAAVPPPDAPPIAQTPAAQKGITEVSLQRLPGFMRPPIPVYRVTFFADGRVVAFMGDGEPFKQYAGTIGERDFKHLVELLEQAKYFDLEPLYTADITDQETVITSVVKDSTRKEVRDYAHQGPTRLWSIEMVLRGLAADIKWQEIRTLTSSQPGER